MKIFITGATGFIGRALVLRLRRDGHEVVAWVRDEARARSRLGSEVELVRIVDDDEQLGEALAACDAVVNLAGEPLVGRWTSRRRARLIESRVALTRRLVDAMTTASRVPPVLISGSAVGYYGDRGDEVLFESSAPGDDFLARLCRNWEHAALKAESAGVRVVTLRTGIVLGRDGGALTKLLLPFRLGLGGPIGSGRQFMPWIHLRDHVDVIAAALTDERYTGPINATAPNPVTNRQFARALATALGRPASLPLPAVTLRAAMGEAATVLLGGQMALPGRAVELGFSFAFRTIDEALRDIVGEGREIQIRPAHTTSPVEPASDYLAGRKPTYELRARTTVHAPIAEVFEFFSRPENLGVMTPANMGFDITGLSEPIGEGTRISYRIRVGGIPMRWRTLIDAWEPGRRFTDAQLSGPYSSWWHEHRFTAIGPDQTIMEDRVLYAPPFGPLGRIANALFVRGALRAIFAFRAEAIRLRFGALPAPRSAARAS